MAMLRFKNAGLSDSGKTQKWLVTSESGVPLGTVSWYAPWRRYAFAPVQGTVFDAVCLGEVAGFLATETTAHSSRGDA